MLELKELLLSSIVNVKFKKLDGSERIMLCTLQEQWLPDKIDDKSSTPRAKNEDVFTVYDLEKCAWRSFRQDSVLEYYV